ncbi:hypothetical protein [Paenibacillus jilunlii]|uniref:Secreted protein n=1 Tax=Paenibacillus jilunlii TaxID=682956 RepID=A0ABR5SYM8_9BACL|nr:hypothetical protein [Paenibacillus jilunlii]KWX77872.1 hypothetical protein AML91_06395 [Paenibacillus jilunlii]
MCRSGFGFAANRHRTQKGSSAAFLCHWRIAALPLSASMAEQAGSSKIRVPVSGTVGSDAWVASRSGCRMTAFPPNIE